MFIALKYISLQTHLLLTAKFMFSVFVCVCANAQKIYQIDFHMDIRPYKSECLDSPITELHGSGTQSVVGVRVVKDQSVTHLRISGSLMEDLSLPTIQIGVELGPCSLLIFITTMSGVFATS